jgi:hypothetical protein
MSFFNRINTSKHTLQQAVDRKVSQNNVSKTTLNKLESLAKMPANINNIANKGAAAQIKDVLKSLDSSKTGAGKQMAQLLESVLSGINKSNNNTQPASTRRTSVPKQSGSSRKAAFAGEKSIGDQKGISEITAKSGGKYAAAEKSLMAGGDVENIIKEHSITNSGEKTQLREDARLFKDIIEKIKNGASPQSVADQIGIDESDRRAPIVKTAIKQGVKEAKQEKMQAERRAFSQVYQSNAGCKAINQTARGDSSTSLSGSKVTSEYKRVHGAEIFDKANKDVKSAIEVWCNNLQSNVKKATDAFYTPTPGTSNKTTWRGADLTEDGLNKMLQGKNDGSAFRLGQFFSTSNKREVAETFCKTNSGARPVLFKIKGNSSNGVRVGSGLDFNAKGPGGESEMLYSPKACFTIDQIRTSNGIVHVDLTEVKHDPKAPALPY